MDNEQLKQIAQTHSTPAYVFDTDALVERVKRIKDCIGSRFGICYAMKANPFLVQPLREMVDSYEVCSPGEFHICERNKIPMERIVLSGVYKEKQDVLQVMEKYGNSLVYTIESKEQMLLLEACAGEMDTSVNALIRVTSGNQFGMDEEEICQVIEMRKRYPHICFIGLQQYTGTQKKKILKVKEELMHLDQFITQLKETYNFEVKELEYGPGFYVPYFQTDQEEDLSVLKEFAAIVSELSYQGSVTLEMGRYIAAYCGYYITKIVDQKRNGGQNYCIVDGGIHQLSYFGQAMAMKMPYYRYLKETELNDQEDTYTICGALCTVNDVIVKNLPLGNVQIGDFLVFERVGAYSVTEGMYLFLSRDLPKVLLCSKKKGIRVLRERRSTSIINDSEKNSL